MVVAMAAWVAGTEIMAMVWELVWAWAWAWAGAGASVEGEAKQAAEAERPPNQVFGSFPNSIIAVVGAGGGRRQARQGIINLACVTSRPRSSLELASGLESMTTGHINTIIIMRKCRG
jgi:hypothetical protein